MDAYIINVTVRSPRQYWVCAGGANDARSASFLDGCFFGGFWCYKNHRAGTVTHGLGLFVLIKIKIPARASRAILF